MELQPITRQDILNSGISVSVLDSSHEVYQKSADLAAEIANHPTFQTKVQAIGRAVMEQNIKKTGKALNNLQRFVNRSFSKRPYFDASVQYAAYKAVVEKFN